MSGFFESVEELRKYHELPEIQQGSMSGGFDLNYYQRLYDTGHLHCVAALSDSQLVGWGILLVVRIPRRQQPLCNTDVLWSKNGRAGAAVLRRLFNLAENYGAPLLITATAGGRLDNQLARSDRARVTHHTYVYSSDHPDAH